jgi:hypothetical protein
MRYGRRRRQWAALLYVAFGVFVMAMAVASASPVLAVVAALSLGLSVAALRWYPVERDW